MLKPAVIAPASGPSIEREAAIAERRRAHLAAVRYQHPTAELEAFKEQFGLRGYKAAAKEIGCGKEALRGWVREGRLVVQAGGVGVIPVTRYLGPWAGNRPILFAEEAIEAGRELLAAAYRGRGERMAAKWADGRITGKPRQGVVNVCPVCGKERYRQPSHAHLKCCSDLHAQIYRWRTRKGIEGLIRREGWGAWKGRSLQIWLGRLGGRKAPTGDRPRGNQPLDPARRQAIIERYELYLDRPKLRSARMTARAVGVSKSTAAKVIAEYEAEKVSAKPF